MFKIKDGYFNTATNKQNLIIEMDIRGIVLINNGINWYKDYYNQLFKESTTKLKNLESDYYLNNEIKEIRARALKEEISLYEKELRFLKNAKRIINKI